jgi:acetyl esterase/lipase
VVPPNQAVMMHEALAKRGVPTALVMFAGEQHGFRSAPNIRAAVDGEMYFYGKVRVPPSVAAVERDLLVGARCMLTPVQIFWTQGACLHDAGIVTNKMCTFNI